MISITQAKPVIRVGYILKADHVDDEDDILD